VAKSTDLISPVLGSTQTLKLIDKVLSMETIPDVRELRPLLQKG